MSWTDARIQQLKDLWTQGYSASEIAAKLGGVTRNAVIGKVHRLGLSGRPSPIKRQTARLERAPVERKVVSLSEARPVRPVISSASIGKIPAVATAPVAEVKTLGTPALPQPNAVGLIMPSAVLAPGIKSCRWPHGDPRAADFHYCGQPAHPGLPYCYAHCCMAYQGFGRKKQRDEERFAEAAE